MSLITIMSALEQVTALLISFGAVVGMVSPLQLLVLVVLECVFYSVNKCVLLVGWLDFMDGKEYGMYVICNMLNLTSHRCILKLFYFQLFLHICSWWVNSDPHIWCLFWTSSCLYAWLTTDGQ